MAKLIFLNFLQFTGLMTLLSTTTSTASQLPFSWVVTDSALPQASLKCTRWLTLAPLFAVSELLLVSAPRKLLVSETHLEL